MSLVKLGAEGLLCNFCKEWGIPKSKPSALFRYQR